MNSASGQPELAPGTLASLFGRRLAIPGQQELVRVTIGGRPAQVLAAAESQINLVIPEGLSPGPVEYVVDNGRQQSAPMLAELRATAPGVFRAVVDDGGMHTLSLAGGSRYALLATGIGDPARHAVRVAVAGLRLNPTSIERAEIPGVWLIRFELPASLTSALGLEATLWAGGRRGNAVILPAPQAPSRAPTGAAAIR